MIRLLFTFFVFIVFIPIVWKIVNKIFNCVNSALNSPEMDADKILSDKEALNKELNRKSELQKAEAERIKKAKKKLSSNK